MSNTQQIRALGFEFAHLLADPEFRRVLRKFGGRGRKDVIVAADADTFDSVMRRVIKQSKPPVIIFIKRANGYALIGLDPKPWWMRLLSRRKQIPPLRIAPTSTIGMVYDALEAHDKGVAPERWAWFRLRPIDDHALAH